MWFQLYISKGYALNRWFRSLMWQTSRLCVTISHTDYQMDVQPGLSLIIFLLLCIPLSFPMKDSWNTASILLLPLLLCSFSPRRLSHLHERIYTTFTHENQLLWTGAVDHVYIKETKKKGELFGRTVHELEENIAFSLPHGMHCLHYFCCNSQRSRFQ